MATLIEVAEAATGQTSEPPDALYFYSHHSATVGPVAIDVLRAQAAKGSLKPTDPVWREGTHNAVLAAHVDFLRRALAQAPRTGFLRNNKLLVAWTIAIMIVLAAAVWGLLQLWRR
jgi:hypothetical protein